MSLPTALLESPLAAALGLALVHFVWQGFAVGATCALALAALRDRPAETRYAACAAGLLALVAAPVVTTLLILRAPAEPWAALPLVTRVLRGTDAASRAMGPVLPALPVAWGAGVAALQLRLLAAWLRAESLRRVGTRAASLRWRRALDDVRARLGVHRPVHLLESSRVAVPSVVGWLRPVVLVPASLVSGLTPDEIRGLLAHELAHVRRHDYAVNLGQCLVESLLFFHPVTWWLSGRLRAEREFCCDDVAAAVGGGAVAYARTLSSLEEHRGRTALPVLSAKGGSLMSRISRLLDAHAGRRAPGLGVAWITGALAIGSLMAAGCLEGDRTASPAGPTAPAAAPVTTVNADVPNVGAAVARLDAAVARGAIAPEMAAMVRSKLESGDAELLAPGAACAGGAACPEGPGCEGAACVELQGTDGETAACVLIRCDQEDCAEYGVECDAASACGNGVRTVELTCPPEN